MANVSYKAADLARPPLPISGMLSFSDYFLEKNSVSERTIKFRREAPSE